MADMASSSLDTGDGKKGVTPEHKNMGVSGGGGEATGSGGLELVGREVKTHVKSRFVASRQPAKPGTANRTHTVKSVKVRNYNKKD